MGLRSAFFWLAAGLGLAGLLALVLPDYAHWMLIVAGLCFAAAVLAGSRPRNVDDPVAAAKTDSALGLPALAREVFEHLPDPLMLLDVAGRVVFANTAMRPSSASTRENKHVSAVLRTPAVLEAIERTSLTGETSVGRIHRSGPDRAPLSGLYRAHAEQPPS